MFRDQEEELIRLSRQLREETEDEQPEETEELPQEEDPDELDMDDLLGDDVTIGDMAGGVYRNASNDYGKGLRNFASGYQAYNGDKTDVNLQEISDELLRQDEPEEKRMTGLVTAAFLLSAAIVGVLIYWLIKGGIF